MHHGLHDALHDALHNALHVELHDALHNVRFFHSQAFLIAMLQRSYKILSPGVTKGKVR